MPRQKALLRHNTQAEQMQSEVLMRLLRRAKDTEYGRQHGFANINHYEQFAKQVPVNTYE